jgi:uncharacterized protein (DUF362 family)
MGTGSFDALKTFLKGPKKRIEPLRRENHFVKDNRILVSVVQGKDLKRALKESIAMIGGLDKIGIKNKTVLVKPNVVGGRANPTTTNPSVVREVAGVLYEEGASKVYVGDMSALIRGSTKKNMEKTGIRAAAESAGAEVVYFEDYDWIRVNLPEGKYIKEVDVSEWIFRVDRIINLPVIKTHEYAGYSICLKNFVGATSYKQRPYFVDRSHWEEVVAELNLAYTPDLNIADGTKIMISGGPWEGMEKEANIIMASGDRIACDVAGLGLIKALGGSVTGKVWANRQIRRAAEAGLGARYNNEMKLLSLSLDNNNENNEFDELIDKVKKEIV